LVEDGEAEGTTHHQLDERRSVADARIGFRTFAPGRPSNGVSD
jgi:hypothetical protein